LLAQKFDPANGVISGEPVPVVSFVGYDSGTWHTTFAVSQNGLLVYEPGSKMTGNDLSWLDRTGKVIGKVAERAAYKGAGELSPDGKRLAVAMGDPQADIWVIDLARGSRTRLTFGGATHLSPSWSADGQRVLYEKHSGATVMAGTSLSSRLASGGGQEEVLRAWDPSATPLTLLSPQLSFDGRYLLSLEQSGPSGGTLSAMPTTGDKKPFVVVRPQSPQAKIVTYRLSPDARWLAYSSTDSGREEIYVTHFPSGAGRWQVSQNGGSWPAWRRDGKEIYFLGLDGFFHAASVNPKSEELELDQVQALFQLTSVAAVGTPYDAAADGQRFVLEASPESVVTPLVLVTNWTADLKK
jgi:eukaryotic-like serine/threonine-protein kinase